MLKSKTISCKHDIVIFFKNVLKKQGKLNRLPNKYSKCNMSLTSYVRTFWKWVVVK